MSRAVTMAPTLPDPKTDLNGVEVIADQMVRTPKRQWVAIVVFDTVETTINYDSGMRTPKGRILEVEVVQDPAEADLLRDRLVQVRDKRREPAQKPPVTERLFEGQSGLAS